MKFSFRAGKLCLSLVFPVRLGLWIVGRALKGRMPEMADFLRAERKRLCAILRKTRRIRGGFELVRIESRRGECILISV